MVASSLDLLHSYMGLASLSLARFEYSQNGETPTLVTKLVPELGISENVWLRYLKNKIATI